MASDTLGWGQLLVTHRASADASSSPQRRSIQLPISLRTGDFVDLVIDARGNHECDGVLLLDMQAGFWPVHHAIKACQMHLIILHIHHEF